MGSAVNIARRWYVHRSDLRSGKHRNAYLQRAWVKYGEQSFVFAILEITPASDLLEREQKWMGLLGVCDRRKGYNLSQRAGAPMTGRKHRPDTLAKMSLKSSGHNVSPVTRQKIAEKATGRKLSAEHRAKIAAAGTGRTMPLRTDEWKQQQAERMRGRKLSDEHRAKIREGGRQYHAQHSHSARDYVVIAPDGKEMTVHNLEAFCRDNGLAISSMRKVAKGITHQHKGWRCFHKP